MTQRRKAREIVVQALYQDEFHGEIDSLKSLENHSELADSEPEAREYALLLLKGIKTYLSDIDSLIESSSSHWKLSRMALIDKNILRLGVFEIKYLAKEVPVQVAINEAIEIAKLYGSTDSKAFINGILDNIAKSI